ncbi:LysE family translocator [Mesorhizobium marinum]|uniref:LysE family translocator n=1 Tax=Mesorhizobium marinum TaxID=3228790 RepID=A0ABV3QUG6_9HYPH
MADYLPQLILAWSIQAMGILSPGPSVALILGVATTRGRLASLVTAFGVACGSIVLSVATVAGVTAILAQVAELMNALRWAGAAYLAWLAFKAFRNAASTPRLTVDKVGRESAWRTGLAGFMLQISNPKAIMFWLAIASVGGVGDAPLPVVALFVAVAFLNSFLGHGAYALLLSSAPARAAYQRARRWIEGGLGCFFLFAGFKLATARL